jgi:flagellar motor switch/type III secretory pathway protein FliN
MEAITAPVTAAAVANARAIVPPSSPPDPWPQLVLVPALVSVHVPVAHLTVRELFRLGQGSILVTSQASGANVPLCVGAKVLAWGEFQVVGDNLALRIAELA